MVTKRWYILPALLLAMASMALGGCNATTALTTTTPTPTPTPTQTVTDITVTEASALIQANKANPNFVLIDVRTADEYNQGHLENAVLIDYYLENFKIEIGKLDRNNKYLIYCRTGARSAGARDVMKEIEFLDVSNMTGGITKWTAQGLPVVK